MTNDTYTYTYNHLTIERVHRAYFAARDVVTRLKLFPILLKSYETEFFTDEETLLVDLTLQLSEEDPNCGQRELATVN